MPRRKRKSCRKRDDSRRIRPNASADKNRKKHQSSQQSRCRVRCFRRLRNWDSSSSSSAAPRLQGSLRNSSSSAAPRLQGSAAAPRRRVSGRHSARTAAAAPRRRVSRTAAAAAPRRRVSRQQQLLLGAATPGQQQQLLGAASPGQQLLVGAASPGLTPQQQQQLLGAASPGQQQQQHARRAHSARAER